jgi:hypothetical protein
MAFEDRLKVFDMFVQKYSRLPTENDPDYLEMLKMSKYQISDVPMFKPARCANCGSSKNDGRRYVDFGLEVDWYGTVFLCGFCLADVAKAMGLFDKLNDRIKELEEKHLDFESLKNQGANLHETVMQGIKELESHYASIHSVELGSDNYTPSDLDVPSVDETPPSEPATVTAKPRAAKSTPSSGSKNIRSLAELLNEPDS